MTTVAAHIPFEIWMVLAGLMWILGAFVVLIVVSKVLEVRKLTSKEPENRRVSFADEFVTKPEFEEFKQSTREQIKSAIDCIRGVEVSLAEKGEERAVKLHDRINAILSAVSRIEGELHSGGAR